MLTMSRRSHEAVMVGADDGVQRLFKVTVLEVDGERVTLGFEVDPVVPVHRHEVWERMHATAETTQ